jgi:hypothetical protein
MEEMTEISKKSSKKSEDLHKMLFDRLDSLDGKKDGKICKGNVWLTSSNNEGLLAYLVT